MITNADLIREVRKPGKIEMPVNSTHDVFFILVDKSSLIATLSVLEPQEAAPWEMVELSFDNDGIRRLSEQFAD